MEDETAKFGIRIQTSFKDIFSKVQFKFDDNYLNELTQWEAALSRIQKDMQSPNADLSSLISQNLTGAPQYVKDFADSFDFLNGKVSDFSVQMMQGKLATEASNKSFKSIKGLINTFNSDLDNLGLTQEQYAAGVSNGNQVLGNYLGTVDKGKAKFTGYAFELIKAKAATIGMEVATMALNG